MPGVFDVSQVKWDLVYKLNYNLWFEIKAKKQHEILSIFGIGLKYDLLINVEFMSIMKTEFLIKNKSGISD